MSKRAVLCSRCNKLVSGAAAVCPWCGARQPTLWGLGPGLRAWYRDTFEPVTMIMGLCVALYGVSVMLKPEKALGGYDLFRFGSPDSEVLFHLGMTGYPAWGMGMYWTVLTATWLHGGLLHIAFNLSWVRSLGPLAVEEFGPARFVILYILSGVGGFLLSNLLSGSPTIGASCAVFGMQGALLAYGRRRGGTWGRSISREALAYGVGGLVMSAALPGVNNLGHVGGILTGFALGYLLPYKERQVEARASQIVALILLAATAAGFAASIWQTRGVTGVFGQ